MADVSLQEARAAAAELGVLLDEQPSILQLVQDMLAPESLPDGWQSVYNPQQGRREYLDKGSGSVRYTHPKLDYFKGAAWMEAGGLQLIRQAEKTHPATKSEALAMAEYLGISDNEDPYVLELAHMAVNAPLPEGWREEEDAQGQVIFRNLSTGQATPQHPLDAYFLELVAKRRTEVVTQSPDMRLKSALSMKRIAALEDAAGSDTHQEPASSSPQTGRPSTGSNRKRASSSSLPGVPNQLLAPIPENTLPKTSNQGSEGLIQGSQSVAELPGDEASVSLGELPSPETQLIAPLLQESSEAAGGDEHVTRVEAPPPQDQDQLEPAADSQQQQEVPAQSVAEEQFPEQAVDELTSSSRSSHQTTASNPLEPLALPGVSNSVPPSERASDAQPSIILNPPTDEQLSELQAGERLTQATADEQLPAEQPAVPTSQLETVAEQPALEQQEVRDSVQRGSRSSAIRFSVPSSVASLPAAMPLEVSQGNEQERASSNSARVVVSARNTPGLSPDAAPPSVQDPIAQLPDQTPHSSDMVLGRLSPSRIPGPQMDQPLADQQAALNLGSDLPDRESYGTLKARLVAEQAAMHHSAQGILGPPPSTNRWLPPEEVAKLVQASTAHSQQPQYPAQAYQVWVPGVGYVAWPQQAYAQSPMYYQMTAFPTPAPPEQAAQETSSREVAADEPKADDSAAQEELPGDQVDGEAQQEEPAESAAEEEEPESPVHPAGPIPMMLPRTAAKRARVRVAVRVRPPQQAPQQTYVDGTPWELNTEDHTLELKEHIRWGPKGAAGMGRTFHADLLLPPESSTQALFHYHVLPVLDEAVQGVNAAVLAYGQTGSGKTHTMFGPSPRRLHEGVIGMSLDYLFHQHTYSQDPQLPDADTAQEPDDTGQQTATLEPPQPPAQPAERGYSLCLSMLELYNEQLRDLLADDGPGHALHLVDDPVQGIRVHGLSVAYIDSYEEAVALIARGNAHRSVGATSMNEMSSRSHTVVRLTLEFKPDAEQANSGKAKRSTSLCFVDLAGSERLARTNSSGIRFLEGTNINLSLLMLGSVVASLATGKRPEQFIPYRNSKLTRLLQPCLGGNAKTVIVATVNPSHHHVDETVNTLMFAQRAMSVVNTLRTSSDGAAGEAAKAGQTGPSLVVSQLQAQVASLQAKLSHAQSQLTAAQEGSQDLRPMTEAQQAALATSLAQMAADKAILLDRIEALTGLPQGGPWEELPPTPPGLGISQNKQSVRSSTAFTITPDKALRSIMRIATLGHMAVGRQHLEPFLRTGRRTTGNEKAGDAPEAVVHAVRQVRSERDELRRRDIKMRAELTSLRERCKTLEPYTEQQDAVEECCAMLEDLIGPMPNMYTASIQGQGADAGDAVAAGLNTVDRLREGVESVVLLVSELSTIQRQLMTSMALQRAAEQRADQVEQLLLLHSNERNSNAGKLTPHGSIATARSKSPAMLLKQPSVEVQPAAPPAVTGNQSATRKPKGFFSSLFGGGQAAEAAPMTKPALTADPPKPPSRSSPARPLIPAVIQKPSSSSSATKPWQSPRSGPAVLEEQLAAVKQELAVVKGELDKWRGFTESQDIFELARPINGDNIVKAQGQQPTAEGPDAAAAAAAGGAAQAHHQQISKDQVVLVGSLAVRACREARLRAATLEQKLQAAERERAEALGRLAQYEGPQHDDASAGRDAQHASDAQERSAHIKAHVVALSHEVAALTKERDALLSMVLQLSAQQRQTGEQLPVTTHQVMDHVFLTGMAEGSYPWSSPPEGSLMVPAPIHRTRPPVGRNRGHRGSLTGGHLRAGGITKGFSSRSWIVGKDGQIVRPPVPGRRSKGSSNQYSPPARPDFDSAPVSVEVRSKLQQQEDRMIQRKQALPGVGGLSENALSFLGVVNSMRDVDTLNLKRKLVLAEKARKDAEAAGAMQVRAMQAEMASVMRQAAIAASSHAASVQELEQLKEEELARVKNEASSAITALMQENNRLKTLVASNGSLPFALPSVLPSLRGKPSLPVLEL